MKYRITVQRYTTTTSPLGGEAKVWADYVQVWAEVSFGTGKERREAAQMTASAPATFHVLRNSKTATITPADRLTFDGGEWDITSAVPSKIYNDGIDITATRRTM